jgi:hypothetical protein
MDENVKAKLDAILKRDQEKQAQAQEAQNKAKSDVKARQEQWSKHVNRVFIPALQPITEMLNQKGWICKIEQTEREHLDGGALPRRYARRLNVSTRTAVPFG